MQNHVNQYGTFPADLVPTPTYINIQKTGVIKIFKKEMNTCIQQVCIKLIISDSKDIFNITKLSTTVYIIDNNKKIINYIKKIIKIENSSFTVQFLHIS